MPRRINWLIPLMMAAPLCAQRGYPQIEWVYPGAVSRGTETTVVVAGHYTFKDPVRVLFEGEGVEASIVEWKTLADAKNARKSRFPREGVTIKVNVRNDAATGVRGFRILTKGSLSTIGHLLVTGSPASNEKEPNDTPAAAQAINVPQTINGLLDQEADIDVYRFRARAGDEINFVVHAARLQRPVPVLERAVSDIAISLHDESGKEIAAADDWLGEDPQLHHRFEREGTYYLYLSESRYLSGQDRWWYALSVSPGPRPRPDLPPANSGIRQISESGRSGDVELPSQVSGCICGNSETDRFRFPARRGQRFEFQVDARKYGSALDPLLEIRDANGKLLDANDDQAITVGFDGRFAASLAIPPDKDPRLEWTAPADATFELAVRDANYFGSPDHIYRLTLREQQPDFSLIVDDDRLPIGPGDTGTAVVTVIRKNGFAGPIELFVRDLPAGLTAMPSVIPSHLDQGNVVIAAAASAPIGVKHITIGGRSGQIERTAVPHAPMGSVNGKTMMPVNSVAAAVVEAADITVEASPRAVVVQPGESFSLDLTVHRNNYSGPLDLNVISWILTQEFSKLPKGLVFDEKGSKTSLAENETRGRVSFRVLPDAPDLNDYLMTILGQIAYNRVFVTRSAAPFRLTIRRVGLASGSTDAR